MKHLSAIVHAVARFLVLWFVDGLSLWATAAIIPGIALLGDVPLERMVIAFAAAFFLGLVNLLLRPLILLIARPLGFIAVFAIGFFANALALLATAWLLPGFEISGLLPALIGSILFTALNTVLTGILELDDEGSFFQGVIERRARLQPFTGADEPGRGLMMIEIDGLSYFHLKKALEEDRLPTLRAMIDEEGYELSHVDCGLPSQTSACQAGILYGDNHDIPAFRWYDKAQGRLIVSGSDAAELAGRYTTGNGLLRGGSSISNMLDGDAEKSLLTVSNVFTATPEESKRRAEDIYLLLLNPYFLMRTVSFFLVDAVREVWQYWGQVRRDEQPRLNRLAHAYPFVRAATTVFVRDIGRQLAVLDILRGAPAIYFTWPGYDEVAHHSGPWSEDAFKVLEKFDHVIAHLRRVIHDKAPRPYDLILLADHGQSFGLTFKQRYGVSLKEFIEGQLPAGTTVTQSMGGDTGAPSLNAMSGELSNVANQEVGNAVGREAARQGHAMLKRGSDEIEHAAGESAAPEADEPAQVTAYGSGNLAQVYFDLYPRKIVLSELEVAYPGMVDALVDHEGIGFVCGYDDDGTPVALSENGRRNLHTGEVTGEDPLAPYAPDDPDAVGHASIETRVWQVRRVMDFPSAGDLMVISTVYPDGTVAALEELIGNHGGLGGEQTDAFLFHPPDMEVGPTRNSIDVFHILNEQRGKPALEGPPPGAPSAPEDEDPWTRENLVAGLRDVRHWMGLAGRALFLDRRAYKTIVADPRMTAPGLFLGLLFGAVAAIVHSAMTFEPMRLGLEWLGWFVEVLLVFGAGLALTRKGTYTRTMRALGFAHVTAGIGLLALVPPLAPLAILTRTVVAFFAAWMAAAEAHETKGWRTLALPVVAIAALVLVPLIIEVLFGSAALGIESVLEQFGLVAPE